MHAPIAASTFEIPAASKCKAIMRVCVARCVVHCVARGVGLFLALCGGRMRGAPTAVRCVARAQHATCPR